MKTMVRAALIALLFTPVAALANEHGKAGGTISRSDIEKAQKAWCDALIEIGAVGAKGGDVKAVAERVLSTAYNYDRGGTLFKPTLTHGDQTFRMNKAGALAYFVGGDATYPNDSGFALKQWVECTPTIAGIVGSGNMTVSMGNVELKDAKGNTVKVDKTFGYIRGTDDSLRIAVHHSSLPYTPAAK